MTAIKVNIVSYIDDGFPGIVKCIFTDANGKEHIVHEKVPVITLQDLDKRSFYPCEGFIACEIIKVRMDNRGRAIYTVNTEKPWDISTVDDVYVFDVLKDQLIGI